MRFAPLRSLAYHYLSRSTRATKPFSSASTTVSMSSMVGFKSREVDKIVISREQAEGAGSTVYRSIGGMQLRNFDPFLMLDLFDSGAPDPNNPSGFPDHPHRGFETVSYILEGGFQHEDFDGNKGTLGPGDLQWMTAGRGILHSEMPLAGVRTRGLQLWVNLKSQDKLCPSAYQELKSEQIPVVTEGGVTAIVIAGTALGTTSKVYTRTPSHYIHYKIAPGGSVNHAIPAGWNAFLFTLTGKLTVNNGAPIGPHNTVTLKKDGEGVTLSASSSENASRTNTEFVLICGEPTGEPIVQHGPFVMNTQEEIREAISDYQYGRNGFEKAPGWYSTIGLPITHADQRRR